MIDLLWFLLYPLSSRRRKAQIDAQVEAFTFLEKMIAGGQTYHVHQLRAALALTRKQPAKIGPHRFVKADLNPGEPA